MTDERLAEIEATLRQNASPKGAALLRELVSEIRGLQDELAALYELVAKYRTAASKRPSRVKPKR